jgi:hypothetical protein
MISLKQIGHDFLAHQLPDKKSMKSMKGEIRWPERKAAGDVATKASMCSNKTGIAWNKMNVEED